MRSDDFTRTPEEALVESSALWIIGYSSPSPLVDAAVAALVADRDSPALRELAGMPSDADWWSLSPVVTRAFGELGLTIPDPDGPDTRLLALRQACVMFLDGAVPMRDLTGLAHSIVGHEGPAEAQELVVLDDELDDGWLSDVEAQKDAAERAARFLRITGTARGTTSEG